MLAISSRSNTYMITVGAACIAAGPALFGLYPGLKIEGVALLALGVAITANGLLRVNIRRSSMHIPWKQDRILKALRSAPENATVQILQTWFPEEDFIDHLERLYIERGKRFHLYVMLMNYNEGANDVLSGRVKLRWIQREKAARDIAQSCDGLLRLKHEVDQHLHAAGFSQTIDVQIKLYDFMPFGPIYKIGNEVMFVGFYLNYTSSVFGPMIEVRRNSYPHLWKILERNLNNGWEDSAQLYPSVGGLEGVHV